MGKEFLKVKSSNKSPSSSASTLALDCTGLEINFSKLRCGKLKEAVRSEYVKLFLQIFVSLSHA